MPSKKKSDPAKPEAPEIPALNSKQIRHLRGLGHHLEPKAMIGREGVTDMVVAAVNAVLVADELVKVKVQQNCPLDRRQAAEELADRCAAALVQVIGRNFLIFRPNPEAKPDRSIVLP